MRTETRIAMTPRAFASGMRWLLVAYLVLALLVAFLLGALLSAYAFEDMNYKERIIRGQNLSADRLCMTAKGDPAYCKRFIESDCQNWSVYGHEDLGVINQVYTARDNVG